MAAVRVIGVVDLKAGRAVRARAGARDGYATLTLGAGSPLGEVADGDALALARAYRDRLGLAELYAADLDAILGRGSQDVALAALAALGVPLWLDAAVTSAEAARRALTLGAARVVVGLETLPSYDALGDICRAVGGERVAFSLDLRDGTPLVRDDAPHAATGEPPAVLAARAAEAGAAAILVIDLARVGTGRGLDLDLLARVRKATPGLTLLAGGGVRGPDDLVRLAACGCEGALVATALQDGRLGPGDVAAVDHDSSTR